MKIDACFQLGYITGTHGLSGDVHAYLDTDRPENYKDLESVFVLDKEDNALIPFFILNLNLKADKAVIRLEEIDSKDQARKLVGCSLYLPLDRLPAIDGDGYYYHELIEWTVRDQQLGVLGPVTSVNLQSPQRLLVMDYKGREVLIPFTDEVVLGIDREQQLVNVVLPDGLLDVYLED